jgi:hypothetical protein
MSNPRTLLYLLLLPAVLLFIGCPDSNRQEQPKAAPDEEEANPYLPAETAAKRVALYRIAYQEGELAPFTAMTEALKGVQVPEVARSLNEMWWKVDWSGARLAPLESSRITALQPQAFPLIAARLEETNSEQGWCLYTLGFDADAIRVIVAEAHADWQPEERELYLAGTEPDCLQVWCVRLSGEWKILAHLPCPPSVSPPRFPESPETGNQEPASPSEGE